MESAFRSNWRDGESRAKGRARVHFDRLDRLDRFPSFQDLQHFRDGRSSQSSLVGQSFRPNTYFDLKTTLISLHLSQSA